MLHSPGSIAALVGCSPAWVRYLAKEGLLPKPDLDYPRHWLWSEELGLVIVDRLRSGQKLRPGFSVRGLAKTIGVCHNAVNYWIKRGWIPGPDIASSSGGHSRYSHELGQQIISNPPRAGERHWGKGGKQS